VKKCIFSVMALCMVGVVSAQNLQTIRQDEVKLVRDRQQLKTAIAHRQQTVADQTPGHRQVFVEGIVRSTNCLKNTIIVRDRGLKRNFVVHAKGYNGVVLKNPEKLLNLCRAQKLRPGDLVSVRGELVKVDGYSVVRQAMLRLKRRG